MKHTDLPERWQLKIKKYLCGRDGSDREKLRASDFDSTKVVKVKFEDDSTVVFFYSLLIEAPKLNEFGVFTNIVGIIFSVWVVRRFV